MRENKIPVWAAQRDDDLSAHYGIRHRVFVNEQGVLTLTDVDQHDDTPGVVHALAAQGEYCAGAVRLYPLDDKGRWKGDRLAVLRNRRVTVIGAHLVRFATATASAQGGVVMEATVQTANVKFFQRLGWTCEGETEMLFGLPHQPMLFDLTTAPPLEWPPRPTGLIYDRLAAETQTALCPAE